MQLKIMMQALKFILAKLPTPTQKGEGLALVRKHWAEISGLDPAKIIACNIAVQTHKENPKDEHDFQVINFMVGPHENIKTLSLMNDAALAMAEEEDAKKAQAEDPVGEFLRNVFGGSAKVVKVRSAQEDDEEICPGCGQVHA